MVKTIFCLLFGGVGVVGLIFLVVQMPNERRESSLREQHADEPWKWKLGWPTGQIPYCPEEELKPLTTLAAWWILVSLPATILFPFQLAAGNYWSLLAIVFPLVSCLLAVYWFRKRRQFGRFGKSTFSLAETPGVVGGQLAGAIRLSRPVDFNQIQQKLTCVKVTHANKKTIRKVQWQTERKLSHAMRSSGKDQTTAIPVLFAIPFDAPPTNFDERIEWKLKVSADALGWDYESEFEIPVFKTAESSADFELDESLIDHYEVEYDAVSTMNDAGIQIVPTQHGDTLVFPPGREDSARWILAAITLPVVVATLLGAMLGAPLVPLIVGAVFGSIFTWGTLEYWFHRSRIEDRHGFIKARAGIFGFGRERRFDKSDIQEVVLIEEPGTNETYFYRIGLNTGGMLPATVARHVKGKTTAVAVKEHLEQMIAS